LEKVCEGVSKRISFTNKLTDAPQVFFNNKNEIEKVFHQFMRDAQKVLPY
jgi:hypothetical protein